MKKLENIPNITEVKFPNGTYQFKLGKKLHDTDTSVNELMNAIRSEYKVIAKYIYGDVTTKIDMGILDRVCHYFQCGITDIIEFIPDKKP